MLPILLLAIVLPLSMCCWIIHFLFLTSVNDGYLQSNAVTPFRWLVGVLLPILISGWALKKKSLDVSGAIMALLCGFVLTLSNACFTVSLLTFFLVGTKATKFKAELKKKIEDGYKDGGQRNWIQVLCNAGVATELALLYMIDRGCGESVIDFKTNYRGSWLAIGVMASLACCCGDTLASELGSVMGNSQPFLITSLERVPRGTNGAVSLAGLFSSALGGFLVGLAYYSTLLLCINGEALMDSPPQWPIICMGTLGGFLGSLFDSIMGATLQFSGQDVRTGKIVEREGPGVKRVTGIPFLDNHSVNLISSLLTGLILPRIAITTWDLLM